jgi:4-hydroxythreonine-4-phosphate dehydrogenase
MSAPFAPVLLTAGDPAGIGPEIVVQACLERPDWAEQAVIVGHLPSMERAWRLLQPNRPSPFQGVDLCAQGATPPARAGALRLHQVAPEVGPAEVPWGQISRPGGHIAAESVMLAAMCCLRQQASAMVTAPIHKQALEWAGVPYPGHTEMLQHASAVHLGVATEDLPVRMMLATPALRTVLVSIHISLLEAIRAVTPENVLTTLRITEQAEARRLGRSPRIGVAGLNPHAGEGGLMGREEIDIIVPALQQARAEGLQVSGPHPPDTVFMRARHSPERAGEFDVVVAMYHDQGLIPIKYLGLDEGVNITLGLPLVRTSPDHGTAFDLAGTGRANPASFLSAWGMARQQAGLDGPT